MKFKVLVICLLLISSTFAVNVKYFGEVDIFNGHFRNVQLQSSSLVKEIFYDSNNQYLIVQLNGVYYHYCSIPSDVVADWVSSNSLGKYYLSNIKGNFDCRYGGIPSYK